MFIQVSSSDGKTKEVTYTKDNNYDEIWTFVKLFNSSKPYDDDRDTTHPTYICLFLNNGNKIKAWGGTQGFQEVSEGDKNYIFKSSKLDSYFKYLSLRYKP